MSQPVTATEAARILRVAAALRSLLVWFGLHLLLAVVAVVMAAGSLDQGQPSIPAPLQLASFALAVVVLVMACRLAHALDRSVVLFVIGFLASALVPLIGLVCLLVLNGAACQQMRDAGMKIGLLGPNAAERERFARAHRAETPVEPGL